MFYYLCAEIMIDNRKFEKISRALSDATRITILQQIKKKKGCISCMEVNEMLNLTQPSVSHHLKQLADADLIIPAKDGRMMSYTLNESVLEDYITKLNSLK